MSALPPGPSEPPLVQTLRWLLRPISFLESCRRRYGDVFSVSFLGFQTPMVMLSDPEAIRALYSVPGHSLPPGRTIALQAIMGSRSLLLLEGREHLARRRLMLPPFHGERMRAYEATVREVVARDVERWPEREAFALHPRMQAVTLEVILRAVFGVTDRARRAQLADAVGRLLAGTSSARVQFGVLLFRRFGGPDPLAAMAALRREIDGMLGAEIAERRADPREDILSLLVTARFEDGEPMDDAEIRDQLMTLLLAGHETTATALAWTFDLLLRHPHVLERLIGEIEAGGHEAYLRAVVAESLRLRPVVPLAGRRLSEELRVNGHVLPAGTDVTPAIWLAHTRADRYPEPYAFRPERFLEHAPATFAWVPFGGGVRRCIGAAFAEMEMRVALAEILTRRTLRPAAGAAERVARRNVTFSPRTGTQVVAAPRRHFGDTAAA
jgi:cytochrome P450 family 135